MVELTHSKQVVGHKMQCPFVQNVPEDTRGHNVPYRLRNSQNGRHHILANWSIFCTNEHNVYIRCYNIGMFDQDKILPDMTIYAVVAFLALYMLDSLGVSHQNKCHTGHDNLNKFQFCC